MTDLGSCAIPIHPFNHLSLFLSLSFLSFSFSFSPSNQLFFGSDCLPGFALVSSIRILQRNGTNKTYIHIYENIYYGELTHPIMEAEKTHNLLFASWLSRKASPSIIPFWTCMLEDQGSRWYKSLSKGRRTSISQLKQTGRKPNGVNVSFLCLFVLFTSSRNEWYPLILGRWSALLSPLIQLLISFEIPSQTHSEIVFNMGIYWPSQACT